MNLSDFKLEESEQPDEVDFSLADGIFIKSGLFKRANRLVPQHSHEHDHTSFIATGSVNAWCDDEYLGAFVAPASIFIKKHCKHTFLTLQENTLILCIHNISRSGIIDIHDLHEVTFP